MDTQRTVHFPTVYTCQHQGGLQGAGDETARGGYEARTAGPCDVDTYMDAVDWGV